MIQRIQTVYLFFVFVLSALIFFFPVYEYGENITKLLSDEFKTPPDGSDRSVSLYIFPVIISNALVGLIAIVTLFLYKSRKLQIKLSKINILLNLVLIVSLFLYIDKTTTINNASVTYKTAAFFPVLMLLFSFLAKRAIHKDEELVKSADRIR